MNILKNNYENNESATEIYRAGENPEMDSRLTTFFIENHMDPVAYPEIAATYEQIRFMVYTDENERYYPCCDKMFTAIMNRNQSSFLQKCYNKIQLDILALIERQIEDPYEKIFLESLIITKHKHETRDEIMIPSRVEKRLLKIYMDRTYIADPFIEEKNRRNQLARNILDLTVVKKALNHIDKKALKNPPPTLDEIKAKISEVEFKRLLNLSNTPSLWKNEQCADNTLKYFLEIFNQHEHGNGLQNLVDFLGIGAAPFKRKRILWMTDESGQVIMDLKVIRFLINMGHKVILVLKKGPLFTKVTVQDIDNDPVFKEALGDAIIIENQGMSKNDMVRMMRAEADLLVLSDGTSENLNLHLSSTTFARVFKEADCIISRGLNQYTRLFETHFQFTTDIFNIKTHARGGFCIHFKPRHPLVVKFSHQDLENKAQSIIFKMQKAKSNGMTVIFYSGVIGSIPGKIKIAKKIMSIFIEYLTKQSTHTFIINPSQYYEPGMDADDLMYMWEIVQRSGHIDIWRFQTYDDIVKSFELLDTKIPPEWVGKDATYSTGCTKEITIALSVQKKHPEMQIIGPAMERFMRRREYAVGKMYDQRLIERRKK
ncbi:MAG: hypothetical protein GY874_00515 [Desulfobacteraceae bacterium]|nr:hypothetical protein [Desulfobacteraceae bacterium]